MIKKNIVTGIAAMTLFGGVAYVLAVPGTEVMASISQPAVKGDRLDIRPLGTACSQHAWPYYDNACLRDRRRSTGLTREVRVVSTDWLPVARPAAYNAR
jgi:hypothetical protein